MTSVDVNRMVVFAPYAPTVRLVKPPAGAEKILDGNMPTTDGTNAGVKEDTCETDDLDIVGSYAAKFTV